MNFVSRNIFFGMFIISIITGQIKSMERPPSLPSIDFSNITNKTALKDRLELLGGFNTLSPRSQRSCIAVCEKLKIYNCGFVPKDEAYKIPSAGAPVSKVGAPKLSKADGILHCLRNNKLKAAGIFTAIALTADALYAYKTVDAATWHASDLKGKLELMRRRMITSRALGGLRNFIVSHCSK